VYLSLCPRYDDDDNPIVDRRKVPTARLARLSRNLPTHVQCVQNIEPLPPVYHSEIEYEPFERCFFVEPAEIAAMTPEEVAQYRRELSTCRSPERDARVLWHVTHSHGATLVYETPPRRDLGHGRGRATTGQELCALWLR